LRLAASGRTEADAGDAGSEGESDETCDNDFRNGDTKVSLILSAGFRSVFKPDVERFAAVPAANAAMVPDVEGEGLAGTKLAAGSAKLVSCGETSAVRKDDESSFAIPAIAAAPTRDAMCLSLSLT
jgi:predicted metal-dependent phosphotriesterase family hydrolase